MPKIATDPMEQKAIRLPPPLIDRVDAAAASQGLSRAVFIRQAITDAVVHAERVLLARESNA